MSGWQRLYLIFAVAWMAVSFGIIQLYTPDFPTKETLMADYVANVVKDTDSRDAYRIAVKAGVPPEDFIESQRLALLEGMREATATETSANRLIKKALLASTQLKMLRLREEEYRIHLKYLPQKQNRFVQIYLAIVLIPLVAVYALWLAGRWVGRGFRQAEAQ